MPKIHLISLDSYSHTMFTRRGWKPVEANLVDPATFILFSGGSDVSPHLYGSKPHPTTRSDPRRDEIEATLFEKYKDNPKIGICRGGQFLNVMSGGSMYQNVDGHTGSHMLFDHDTCENIYVTSTHHQMMFPSYKAKIICTATISSFRQTFDHEYFKGIDCFSGGDMEVIFYEHTNSLCYQPHPEYGMKSCEDHFFNVIKRYFEV